MTLPEIKVIEKEIEEEKKLRKCFDRSIRHTFLRARASVRGYNCESHTGVFATLAYVPPIAASDPVGSREREFASRFKSRLLQVQVQNRA